MTDGFLNVLNTFAWVAGNVLIAYIAVAVMIFVVEYYILFDPRATTAGKLIFRFFLSLVGIIFLIVLGTFVDPAETRAWNALPTDVDWWRPLARLGVYAYVAFTITSLAVLLVLRKWKPSRLRTSETENLLKVRHDTTELPIVK